MRFVIPAGPPRRLTAAAAVALFIGWLSGLGTAAASGGGAPLAGTPLPGGTRSASKHVKSTPITHTVDCRVKKCIAVTFDDGPGPYTDKLLRMLAAHHARATFFLIGANIRGREATVRRELATGNAIGDHTWTHPQLDTLSEKTVRSELARTLKEIHRATGGTTHLMRPPYGATDKRVGKVAREFGFAQILWDVDTNDWRDRNSKIVAHRAVSWAHRNDIILMHDIHPTTVNAVPKILTGLSRRGFTFVTVPELFAPQPLKPGKVYLSRR
jgi:peptidoglycan/xylan/chitin deacetylase (PgdA/CDA1 family)